MDKKATRESYGEKLVELGKENPKIVVLDADLSAATKTKLFAEKFPDRFFDMGISEQDMIGTAARYGHMWTYTICKYFCSICSSEELMIKYEIVFAIQN